jgi:phage FluMu protein gp41
MQKQNTSKHLKSDEVTDKNLTARDIFDIAVAVEEFIRTKAGQLNKNVSGRDVSAVAGVIDFLSCDR